MAAPENAGPRARRLRLRRVADQLPTRWFGALATAGVLLLTAAFGGLNKVPPKALPTVEIGEAHTTEQSSIIIDRLAMADSIDELPWQLSLEPGDKVVALGVTVTNRWTKPLHPGSEVLDLIVTDIAADELNITTLLADDTADDTANESTVSESENESTVTNTTDDTSDASAVKLSSDDADLTIRRDDTTSIWSLPPGVPVKVAMIWIVDAETAAALASGETMTVVIDDRTLVTNPLRGDQLSSWSRPTPAATVSIVADTFESMSLGDLDATGS